MNLFEVSQGSLMIASHFPGFTAHQTSLSP